MIKAERQRKKRQVKKLWAAKRTQEEAEYKVAFASLLQTERGRKLDPLDWCQYPVQLFALQFVYAFMAVVLSALHRIPEAVTETMWFALAGMLVLNGVLYLSARQSSDQLL